MAISVFPVVVSSSINASAITAVSANTLYEGRATFDPAVYTITCASATIATVEFYSNATTLITTAVTASGTVAVNLASTADRVRVWTDTGSNIVVTITKTANVLTNQFSGTLDTLTTSGTYTGTSASGYAYAVIVGGGGGGGGYTGGTGIGGGAGASGGVQSQFVQLTGSMAYTIGNAGTGVNSGTANSGNATIFAGFTSNGGGGGTNSGAGGAAGTPGGAAGGTNGQSGNSSTASLYPFVVSGTTGSGGAGGNGTQSGGGSGIGTGGQGGGNTSRDANGYGSGGGGAWTGFGALGGNGRPGVIYVLRF